MAGTLLLGGLAPAQAQESGPPSDSHDSVSALYDAKETWGVNWDGWQVAIENATGTELTFKNGSGLFAKSETIAPGATGNVVGRQTWWFGYYPGSTDITYQSGDHDNVNYFLMLDASWPDLDVLVLACGITNENGAYAHFVGCEVTSAVQTEQIKIRFTEVENIP
jgi:hypothetical protein